MSKGAYKVAIVSLGCPRNQVDSEHLVGRLDLKGHSLVGLDEADIAIVNTCAFVDDAKRESIDTILDLIALKKEGRLKKVLVYGCLVQRYKDQLRQELPEVDAFVGRPSLEHDRRQLPIGAGHYAYLKICEGCINRCSYCVIPEIKGPFTSLDSETILAKVKCFGRQKVSELDIIGQDITGYGIDRYGGYRLAHLLPQVARAARSIGWIRLLYLNPERITDELLRVIASEEKICKYIDMPIQHINGRILKVMNRRSTPEGIKRLIGTIRSRFSRVAVRTAVIVGFPSETDREFKELLSFIKEARFEKLGAFIYSREEGTPAYSFKKQVPLKVRRERFNELMQVQQAVSRRVNEGFLGTELTVLIDEASSEASRGPSPVKRYIGRSQFDAPEVDGVVYVDSTKTLKPGDFVNVMITDTLEYDLVGRHIAR